MVIFVAVFVSAVIGRPHAGDVGFSVDWEAEGERHTGRRCLAMILPIFNLSILVRRALL